MPKGLSLHIGLNRVDDRHYRKTIFEGDGWDGALRGCEADALAMQTIAERQGFVSKLLLTTEATRENVKAHIRSAAQQLESGDFFFITYSGHGSQVLDTSGDENFFPSSPGRPGDRIDETWCLYDAQLLDDELHDLWAHFQHGVRILLFSDSCHSGTVSRGDEEVNITLSEGIAFRFAPKSVLSATYKVHKDFYDSLQAQALRQEIKARILLFSGCQDHELSIEDQLAEPPGGLFTKRIIGIWEPGKFNDYRSLFQSLEAEMYEDQQTPNFLVFGSSEVDFEGLRPLELG
jgi:metacaspase-1